MKYWSALLAVLCIAGTSPSLAGPRLMTGEVTQNNVSQLTQQIQWHHSLPQAQYMAQREGKMIFWMHMLGNLSGAT